MYLILSEDTLSELLVDFSTLTIFPTNEEEQVTVYFVPSDVLEVVTVPHSYLVPPSRI